MTPERWRQVTAIFHAARGQEAAALAAAAVRCHAQDAMDQVEASARHLLMAVDEGDTLRTYLAGLRNPNPELG